VQVEGYVPGGEELVAAVVQVGASVSDEAESPLTKPL
jgi:hypothetical protein